VAVGGLGQSGPGSGEPLGDVFFCLVDLAAGRPALVGGQLADCGQELAEGALLAGEAALGLTEFVDRLGGSDEPIRLGEDRFDVASQLFQHSPSLLSAGASESKTEANTIGTAGGEFKRGHTFKRAAPYQ